MKKWFGMTALVCCLMLMGTAGAKDATPLFKEFSYGMPQAEVQAKTGAKPCNVEELENALCQENLVNFAGIEWEQLFIIEENQLVAVALVREDDAQAVVSVATALTKNGFTIGMLQTPGGSVDVLDAIKKGGAEFAQSLIITLEQGYSGDGCIFYTFLEKSGLEEAAKRKIGTLTEYLRTASKNSRGVELYREEGLLMVRFIAPAQALAALRQKAEEAANEKF